MFNEYFNKHNINLTANRFNSDNFLFGNYSKQFVVS